MICNNILIFILSWILLFPLPYFWGVMNEDNEIILIIFQHNYAVVVEGGGGKGSVPLFGVFFIRKPREFAFF